ncbi:unnamed protein product [Soboliphyme baturini]|uniref:WAPL domain-containing protein n=1 Tax=Soboliphyme baturini TaxID=241478 RepID=A0A183ILK9_9BILA|nr:unnamed protein product [Soboliphyme baturini]
MIAAIIILRRRHSNVAFYGLDEDQLKNMEGVVETMDKNESRHDNPTDNMSAGELDEYDFILAFECVDYLKANDMKSSDAFSDAMKRLSSNRDSEWEKRIQALQFVRSVVKSEATKLTEITPKLWVLSGPIESALKDLRSQVAKEACITVA